MPLAEFINAVMPVVANSEKIIRMGLPLKISIAGVISKSAIDGIVFNGSIRGVVNDSSNFLYGKGGGIASLRMKCNGTLITEYAWTSPVAREMGVNSILYEELVNSYFPQAQIVTNSGTYGAVNARRIFYRKMTIKQAVFYRLGWMNYRGRHSVHDFFVRLGANPQLINFPHMERIF